jgi:hypothetical protein
MGATVPGVCASTLRVVAVDPASCACRRFFRAQAHPQ